MSSIHAASQELPETESHGTGSTVHGILDPESLQINHYVFPPGRSESSPVQVLVEHPSGNTTLSVRNQVPGLSRPGQLTSFPVLANTGIYIYIYIQFAAR